MEAVSILEIVVVIQSIQSIVYFAKSKHLRIPMQFVESCFDAVILEVIFVLSIYHSSCANGDVALDFQFGFFYIFGETSDLKHRFLVATGGDNVGVRLLLDPFNGGALRAYHKPHHAVGHADLDGDLTGGAGTGRAVRSCGGDGGGAGHAAVSPRGADLTEVLCSRQNLSLRHGDIFFAARHDEDRLLSTDWGFDVCVCFGSQGFNLASWGEKYNINVWYSWF